MENGKLIIFSAPSGSGKTTIVKHLLATNSNLGFSISACTRDKRGRNEENGKDYILEFMSKGQILGELEMIRQINCLCNVAAVTSVQVYAISSATFKQLLDKDLRLHQILLEELAERIINTSSRASFQQLYTVEHGLTKLLALQEKQGLKITKEDMAAYLGITLRSLNRTLKRIIALDNHQDTMNTKIFIFEAH